MNDRLIIRPEHPEDYAAVEQLTRAAARFDAALPPLPKEHRPSQEECFILSHALLQGEA